MTKVAILIDGGFLRAVTVKSPYKCTPDFIEQIAKMCVADNENVFRILYYDCRPYEGTVRLPISNEEKTYTANNSYLSKLAKKELFAIRLGILKFRGFKLRQTPKAGTQLTDGDFVPDFEQKGVDMRIGLDIANFASRRSVDRMVLLTNDTDFVAAMKHARISGLQIVIVKLPGQNIHPDLIEHSDFTRAFEAWPDCSQALRKHVSRSSL